MDNDLFNQERGLIIKIFLIIFSLQGEVLNQIN